jgi:hypothetical protein
MHPDAHADKARRAGKSTEHTRNIGNIKLSKFIDII